MLDLLKLWKEEDVSEERRLALEEVEHIRWERLYYLYGWQYGERRDDREKRNPCLVPYEELPESEKEYDRVTAMETLRTILSLGYQITKEE